MFEIFQPLSTMNIYATGIGYAIAKNEEVISGMSKEGCICDPATFKAGPV